MVKKSRFFCYRDGNKICGHIWKNSNEKKPVVILSHGFMANEKMCYTYAKTLANMGYIAITFDFCGGGIISSSEGKTEDMTVLTELADLEAVLAYVKTLDYADEDNISLLGCSQGGFVSALAAKAHSEIKNLVLFYPAFCIPDDARSGKMLFFKFDVNNIPDIVASVPMKIGREYVKAVIDWDFKDVITGYEGNTVLVHGTADMIVDIDYARQARACYADCHYYEIKGGTHMFVGKHDREAVSILKKELKLA